MDEKIKEKEPRTASRGSRHRKRDEDLVSRLLDERHHRPGHPRHPRRPEAGASPLPFFHAPDRLALQPALQEVGAHRRRRDGQIPSARRRRHLRYRRAHGPGLLPALSPGRRPGQLRLHRRRPARGHALHRGPAAEDHQRDAQRPGQGHGRLRSQLRRLADRAGDPARPAAHAAAERHLGHRRGHGHLDPAPQPGRADRRLHPFRRQPRRQRRRADEDHARSRFPDRRLHLRPEHDPGRLRDRQGRLRRARQGRGRDRQQGAAEDRGHRDPLPDQQVQDPGEHRRAGQEQAPGRHLRPARRVGPRRAAHRHRDQERTRSRKSS